MQQYDHNASVSFSANFYMKEIATTRLLAASY